MQLSRGCSNKAALGTTVPEKSIMFSLSYNDNIFPLVGEVTRSGPKKFVDEGLRLEGRRELSGFLEYRPGVAFGLVLDKQRCQ